MHTSLVNRIESFAALDPGRVALVHQFREITYGELCSSTLKTETWIRQKGIRPGDWVAITVRDQYLHLLACLALIRTACSQICLPSFERQDTNRNLADRLPLQWQIVQSSCVGVSGLATLTLDSESEIKALPCSGACEVQDKNGSFVVFTSSGTTGRQKLIPFDQNTLLASYAAYGDAPEVTHQRVPIEFNYGKKMIWRPLFAGGTAVTSENGGVEDLLEICRRFEITKLFLSAHAVQELLSCPKPANKSEPLLGGVSISLAGSKIGSTLLKTIDSRITNKLTVSYGTTELGTITRASRADLLANENSVGYPVAGISIQIVDENFTPLPAGSQGLIGVTSGACIKGYLFDDELNAKHFHDGWFYPGDVGSLADDGQLLFYGRADDMIILNSINIFPAEVEKIAEAYAGVVDCAMFPIKSETHGSIPALAVTSSEKIDLDALLAWCRKSLGIRAPRKIFQVDGIPRNPQGKILRRELAEIAKLQSS